MKHRYLLAMLAAIGLVLAILNSVSRRRSESSLPVGMTKARIDRNASANAHLLEALSNTNTLKNLRISTLWLELGIKADPGMEAAISSLLPILVSEFDERVPDTKLSQQAFLLCREMAGDTNQPLCNRIASLALLSETERSEHIDRVALALLLSFHTKEQRLYDVVAAKREESDLAILFMLNDLIQELHAENAPQLGIETKLQNYPGLNKLHFHVPFNLPIGGDDALAKAFSGTHFSQEELGLRVSAAGKKSVTQHELFERLRGNDSQSLPRMLRSRLMIGILNAFRDALLAVSDLGERRLLFSSLHNDLELHLARIYQCDSVHDILESRAIYASCIDNSEIPRSEFLSSNDGPWAEVRALVSSYVDQSKVQTSSEPSMEFEFTQAVNAIGKQWELDLIREVSTLP